MNASLNQIETLSVMADKLKANAQAQRVLSKAMRSVNYRGRAFEKLARKWAKLRAEYRHINREREEIRLPIPACRIYSTIGFRAD